MLIGPLVVNGVPLPASPAVAEVEGEAFMDLFAQVKGPGDGA